MKLNAKLPFSVIAAGLLLAVAAAWIPSKAGFEDTTEKDIKQVLMQQQKAWNNGDIPGFMAGYLRSESLRFASGDSVSFGWQTTLERYQKGYADPDKMGQLAFTELKVLPLSETYAEVFGRWTLKRKASVGDATGLFTLLMKNTDDGWRVFHDHTSVRPPEEKPE